LEKHPWYANQWQARLQDISVADRDMVLFMQAARWTDDIASGMGQGHFSAVRHVESRYDTTEIFLLTTVMVRDRFGVVVGFSGSMAGIGLEERRFLCLIQLLV
jgi:hypothetical protein